MQLVLYFMMTYGHFGLKSFFDQPKTSAKPNSYRIASCTIKVLDIKKLSAALLNMCQHLQ